MTDAAKDKELRPTPLPWQSDYAGNMITDCVPSAGYTFDKVIARFNNWNDVPFVLERVNGWDALTKERDDLKETLRKVVRQDHSECWKERDALTVRAEKLESKEPRPCPWCNCIPTKREGATDLFHDPHYEDGKYKCPLGYENMRYEDWNSADCWKQIDALNARVEEFKALSDSYWDQLCKKDGEIEALRSAGKKLFNQLKEYDDMMWPEGTHVILSETAALFSGEKGEKP